MILAVRKPQRDTLLRHAHIGRRACPNQWARTWRPPLPRPARGPRQRRSGTPGLLELDAQPSAASIRLPEGGAPKVSAAAQVRRAHIRIPTRHRTPDQEPGRILIPGDGAAGDQEAQNTFACAEIAGYATPVACPSQRLPSAMLSGAHRLVADRARGPRSAWFNQARLALLAVTLRYKRTPCLWLEQFQIAAE